MYQSITEHLHNRKILILGFGSEGRSSYNFIRKHLSEISPEALGVADTNPIEQKIDLPGLKVEKITGTDYLKAIPDYDLVLKSPGIKFNIFNKQLVDNHWELKEFPGVEISSQLDLFLRYTKAKVIGVSGSKGKSTTTSLVYEILKQNQEDAQLLGNIGIPVLDHFDELDENSYCAVEMGVHQLEFTMASPDIAVLTNLYPEHLDHYKDYADYIFSKLNILRWQDENDFAVLVGNEEELVQESLPLLKSSGASLVLAEDEHRESFAELLSAEKLRILETYKLGEDMGFIFQDLAKEIEQTYRLKENTHILGRHNQLNSLLAIGACKIWGIEIDEAISAVSDFKGLEHRLEDLGLHRGVRFFNDSIATIPASSLLALEALKPLGKVSTLLVGGLDRSLDYRDYVAKLYDSDLRTLICFPDTGQQIIELVQDFNTEKARSLQAIFAEDMTQAVKLAYEHTDPGEICLLSPAAASYNQYKSFAERGNRYKEEIKRQE